MDNNVPAWKPPADIPIPGLPPIRRPHTKGRAIRFLEETVQEEEEEGQLVVVKASAGKGKEREREPEKKHLAKASKQAKPVMPPTHRTMAEETSSGKPSRALQSTSLAESNVDDEDNMDAEEINGPPCTRCAKNKLSAWFNQRQRN